MKWMLLAAAAFGLVVHGPAGAAGDPWRPGAAAPVLPRLAAEEPSQAPALTEFLLPRPELEALLAAAPGEEVGLPSVRLALNEGAAFRIRRVRLYAPGVRPEIPGGGPLAASRRLHFVGAGGRGAVGFSLDPASGALTGVLSEGGAMHVLSGRRAAGGLVLRLAAPKAAPGFARQCETDHGVHALAGPVPGPAPLSSRSGAAKGGEPVYLARIAVDTDNEFLADKFGNDPRAATVWIEELFLALNVIFNRDLDLALEIGALVLRTDQGSDPYADTPPGGDYLGEFGALWLDTPELVAVEREFALLLSGRNISRNSFSGVAWVDAYCRKERRFTGSAYGSFSINRIGSRLSPGFAAGGVGHELGHNLGAFHTHCERLRNGGTEFVDECFVEGGGGCFSGEPSCVADGVGSMMSYCHLNGISGCRTSDVFDPLIVDDLLSIDHMAGNYPGCIRDHAVSAGADTLFASGFEADP